MLTVALEGSTSSIGGGGAVWQPFCGHACVHCRRHILGTGPLVVSGALGVVCALGALLAETADARTQIGTRVRLSRVWASNVGGEEIMANLATVTSSTGTRSSMMQASHL